MKKIVLFLLVATLGIGNVYSQAKKRTPVKRPQTSAVSKQNALKQDTLRGEFSRVVNVKGTPKQIFQYSKSFFATKISNYQNAVQFEDASTNKIQLRTSYSFETIGRLYNFKNHVEIDHNFNLILECKQNKFRISIEKPLYDYRVISDNPNWKHIGDWQRDNPWATIYVISKESSEVLANRLFSFYNSIADDLASYIKKKIEGENF